MLALKWNPKREKFNRETKRIVNKTIRWRGKEMRKAQEKYNMTINMYVENRVKIGVACCEIFNRQEYRSWCATMKTAPFMPQIDRKSMISNFKRKKNRTQIRGHKNATEKKILGLNGIPKLTTIHAGNRLALCKQPFYKIHFFPFFCYSHRLFFDFSIFRRKSRFVDNEKKKTSASVSFGMLIRYIWLLCPLIFFFSALIGNIMIALFGRNFNLTIWYSLCVHALFVFKWEIMRINRQWHCEGIFSVSTFSVLSNGNCLANRIVRFEFNSRHLLKRWIFWHIFISVIKELHGNGHKINVNAV